MQAMIKVSYNTAKMIWRQSGLELYQLFEDGSEHLVDDTADLVEECEYGIEGELFGLPYAMPSEELERLKTLWHTQVLGTPEFEEMLDLRDKLVTELLG